MGLLDLPSQAAATTKGCRGLPAAVPSKLGLGCGERARALGQGLRAWDEPPGRC